MQEITQAVLAYVQQRPLVALATAFVAGFAGNKTVAYDRSPHFIFHLLVGLLGFFLGQFVILFFGLLEYIESLPEFRLLFDFVAAYIGSFVLAAVIHFVKPM
jgi:uncharacterized membrane protein YeaQ/YmgE (transglycosylase-associated protein family)